MITILNYFYWQPSLFFRIFLSIEYNWLIQPKYLENIRYFLFILIITFIPDPAFRERQLQLCDFTKRSCSKLVKTLVVLQARHPYSFGDQTVLPAIIDFSLNMITNPDATIVSFEQFLIQCMVLVKSILECKEYKPSLTGRVINESAASLSLEQRKKNISTAVSDMIKTILPSDRVILLCNVLIRRYSTGLLAIIQFLRIKLLNEFIWIMFLCHR